jgi:hypothetical protein
VFIIILTFVLKDLPFITLLSASACSTTKGFQVPEKNTYTYVLNYFVEVFVYTGKVIL